MSMPHRWQELWKRSMLVRICLLSHILISFGVDIHHTHGLGVTTVVDMTLHPSMTEPTLEASRKSGLRMVHCFARQQAEAYTSTGAKQSQLSIIRSRSSHTN